jgi:hypothetical protein
MRGFFIVAIYCCWLLVACKDNGTREHDDYLFLKQQVGVLQNRIDSLVQALHEKQPAKTIVKPRQKVKGKTTKQNSTYSPTLSNDKKAEANYIWKNTVEKTTPGYQKKKETTTYEVRTGAICCDGTRSNATGRGACSHHGGVCKWLYQ